MILLTLFMFVPQVKMGLDIGVPLIAKLPLNEKLVKMSSISPSIDDLLRLPLRPSDGGKTKEEILDEQDEEIRKRQEKYDEDEAKRDKEIDMDRKKKEEREINLRVNTVLRNRLEMELTEAKMRSAVQANVNFLKTIQAGVTPSGRHEAFKKSVKTREGLRYTMITDPFTNNQLNWTMEELGEMWMRNKKEQRDNSEYVWHVLLPEVFIKVQCCHNTRINAG